MRRSPHVIGIAAGASLACVLAGAATATAATSAKAAPPPAAAKSASPVIVILNNQSGNAATTESPVISQVKAAGGTNVISYSAVASFAATVSPAEAATLAANPAVASVVPDQKINVTPPTASQVPATPTTPTAGGSQSSAICGTASKPLLPEDLTTTHANEAHAAGITGAGVTVAWIADGLDPNNPDFLRGGKSIFKDYVDFSGDGPDTQTGGEEAFGDASMIAAQGNQVYDLSSYNNPAFPLPKNCDIKVEGMAPGASLIGLKAGGEFLANSAILQSIDYAITHGANVINESFGANVYSDNNARDSIQMFDDAAVRHGITVTVSTGDAGISGTQGGPSTDPNVISAGASTDFQSYEQTGYAGARTFSNGKWVSGNISALSSGGISQGGQVPDLVAPGEADWSLCSTNTAIFTECLNNAGKPSPILLFGGTSEASPVTAGAAALVIQAYRQYHHGVSPSPALVKQFLTTTAGDLGLPAPEQGSGLLNADAAVQAAEHYKGSSGAGQGGQVISSPTQTLLSGAPNAHVSTGLTVTNSSSKSEKVTLGTRNFAQTSSSTQNVALDPASEPTFPFATNGLSWAYKKVTFNVSGGAARLGVSIDWKGDAEGVAGGSVVRLTLIGPDGSFVTNTRPQGGPTSANFGFVDVAHPQRGTWTAILYTPTATTAAVAGQPGSYTGNVILDATTQKDVADGSVSPSTLVLGPGQTGHAQLRTSIDGTQGDTAESVTVGTSGGQHSSIPVVLRPVIPVSGGKGTFSGTITGGNARAVAPTQTNTYSFNVPKGQKDLNVGVHLNSDPNVLIEGALIDPDGETVDVNTNATSVDSTTGVISSGPNLQLVQSAPESGQWRFVLIVVDPVSGAEVSQTFSGTIGFDEAKVSSDLPASTGTALAAGQASSFTINYTNPGSVPEPVQVDPRLKASTSVALASLSGTNTVTLPLSVTNISNAPFYLVPPGTSQVTVAATSSTPAQVELAGPLGEPDVVGDLSAAQAGDLTSVARVTESGGRHQVARGFWSTFVQQIGPFTDAGAPAGTSTLTATAVTQPLDPSVTSAAGDPYAPGFTGQAPTGTPVTVAPGQSGGIKVTITPTGKSGTVVHGVIYLVTSALNSTGTVDGAIAGELGAVDTSGDVLAAVPYTYTVK
jgi:Peptidase inhibitor I9